MVTDNINSIQRHILDYYQNLFRADTSLSSNTNQIKSIIPSLVTVEDNLSLSLSVSLYG